MTSATPVQVSIVIPCHSERGWDTLVGAVASALAQQPPPTGVIVVVDHNPRLYDRARRELSGVTVLQNGFARGASGTRNTGARHTTTPLVAFLDGDITAGPQWLAQLVAPFDDPAVVGTGGAIAAAWERTRPSWLPDELLWAVGASYTGMPVITAPVRNVWSASMAVLVTRGSTTMTVASSLLSTRGARSGWLSAMLAPIRRMQSAESRSA